MPTPRPLNATLLHIMLTLAGGVRHGYAIKREIEQRTQGAIRLGPASLYVSLQKLQSLQFIIESNQPIEYPDARPNQRYYRLTDEGRDVLRLELDRLERLVAFGRSRPGLSGEPS